MLIVRLLYGRIVFFFFFKQKTAYEMRISDWSSDVCSSDLLLAYRELVNPGAMPFSEDPATRLPEYFISADDISPKEHVDVQAAAQKWVDSSISKTAKIGRASCRERVCQYV